MPTFLKEGDLIEIVAPSKYINKIDIQKAINLIQSHGFNVKITPNLFNKKNNFSGTIKERTNSIQLALDDCKTKAIFFARGGYGAIQIIDYINFKEFSNNPKWLVGFSDITIILIHIYMQHKIKSIHGPMPFNFNGTDKESLERLFKLIKGEIINFKSKSHKLNKPGIAQGVLIGGNLSIICSLIGSKSFMDFHENYILFIEEVDEYLYHLERMIYTLDRLGFLKNIKGLIVGQMTNMMDNKIVFGKSSYQIIRDIINKYDYPVCFNFPLGHSKENMPVIVGSVVNLKINEYVTEINYE